MAFSTSNLPTHGLFCSALGLPTMVQYSTSSALCVRYACLPCSSAFSVLANRISSPVPLLSVCCCAFCPSLNLSWRPRVHWAWVKVASSGKPCGLHLSMVLCLLSEFLWFLVSDPPFPPFSISVNQSSWLIEKFLEWGTMQPPLEVFLPLCLWTHRPVVQEPCEPQHISRCLTGLTTENQLILQPDRIHLPKQQSITIL